MFPDAATLGVDVIIPDMSYLFERAEQSWAIFLTHGHEDHIGAVPFLVEQVARAGLRHAADARIRPRQARRVRTIDEVELRAIHAARRRRGRTVLASKRSASRTRSSTRSAFAITTPAGTIIHTGDFKIDHTPVDGKPTDLARFAAYGEAGVLLLVSDSTNALVPGHGARRNPSGARSSASSRCHGPH